MGDTKGGETAKRVLLVDLEHSLPDVDSYNEVPEEYERLSLLSVALMRVAQNTEKLEDRYLNPLFQ